MNNNNITYDSFSEPVLKELLTVYNIEFNSSYDRQDLLDLFENRLLPILKSQAFNNYFQKHGVHNICSINHTQIS